jgi:hypothetical protein
LASPSAGSKAASKVCLRAVRKDDERAVWKAVSWAVEKVGL